MPGSTVSVGRGPGQGGKGVCEEQPWAVLGWSEWSAAGTERNILASRVLRARPSGAGGRGRGKFCFPIDIGSHGEHLAVLWFPYFLHSMALWRRGKE